MPLPAGTLLNHRYPIVSILGQGGMGAVYRASDEHLNIPVAVKENLFLTDEYTRQFQREARILASMRHPGLPHVADYFVIDGQGQYLVMDYIEGEDLRQRMERSGPLPERDAILIGISVLDALYHLHTRTPPVIHRDIKPGNIKVTLEGSAVLVDFGLAKIMQPGQATQTGARAMTPGYSPPEQYGTSRTDARSDVYSLGATLYAALTGTIPEDGLNRMTGKAELTDIRSLRPKINRRLAEIIERAMEVEPDDRFQTAEEFRKALIECGEMAAYFRERPTLAPPPAEAAAGSQENERTPNEAALRRVSRPSSRSRKARQALVRNVVGVILFAALVLAIAAVITHSDISGTVRGYFGGPAATPSPAATATSELAGNKTSVVVENPTPSPQPTALATRSSLTLTPTIEAQAPQPSPTAIGRSGEIAFASERTGMLQIWIVNAGNKQIRQVTNMQDGACQPTWSPDGNRIAFISPCSARKDIYAGAGMYVINVDGSSLTPLPASPEGDFDPAWSPDGKHIAFTSLRTGRPSIFLMDMDTLGVTEISQSLYADLEPAWSPNSHQITFVRRIVYGQIWTMSEDGSQQEIFAPPGNVNNSNPCWSADGQVILYSQSSNESPPWLVGMRYEDRKKAREFRIPAGTTTDVGPIAGIAVSPDGYWIAYESWPNANNHDIYLMTSNCANVNRLTTDPGLDFGPAWRPIATRP